VLRYCELRPEVVGHDEFLQNEVLSIPGIREAVATQPPHLSPIGAGASGQLRETRAKAQRRGKPINGRESFVRPILNRKGWSIHDWAVKSDVDFHTANNYLNGKTNPFPSTRKKLADALGIRVKNLPE